MNVPFRSLSTQITAATAGGQIATASQLTGAQQTASYLNDEVFIPSLAIGYEDVEPEYPFHSVRPPP